ncbi:hypothetical protein AGABI1DRAFT_132482 [Agaricus bisporus var. burnettii JB137-S8]|uniref:Ricin B lectin domain-containing protein n=2 Tax=Agaricus bisporus var. burnettii TaxID=192524 RepID=K5VLG9_AGABU|nr:uncharacterized protein AGABI1DRAFT_132482 [Agaricus bisporus var. burnettii JB137-S8]EKM75234.1 hypothetical protein AGABI1DRAFT_132482 [Agaricus bisporus var. burnettii JB137-S8]KAF7760680.1 hypothetical protein Agabi119p4_10089 [Agaricus bisporus var. burnettii]
MSLENGTYQIKSILTKKTIGRNSIEFRSYGPKPIILQEPSIDHAYTIWQIERCGDNYYLKNGGAATGLADGAGDTSGKIFAIVRERLFGHSREWKLRPAAGIEEEDNGTEEEDNGTEEGDNGTEEGDTYNICNSDEGSNLVWTVEEVEEAPNGGIVALAEFDPSNSRQVFTFIKEDN